MTKMMVERERSCPVCGSREYSPFADERINEDKLGEYSYASRKLPEFMCLRLVRCEACELVYAPTTPETKVLQAEYEGASFDSQSEAILAAQTYAQALEPFLTKLPRKPDAVDVGAGSGPLLPLLERAGFDRAIGIEPSLAAIEAAPAQVRAMLREGMFSPQIVEDLEPTLVCSFMTLEHIDNPGVFVQQAWDLLEPGGMIAVVVHDWQASLNRILGMKSPIIDVEHLQLFSRPALRRLFEGAGFEQVEIQSLRNTYPLRYWLRLAPFPNAMKNAMISALHAIRCADVKISVNVGNMLAVGYKPRESAP
ncbi:MAG: class I SAM-dependent methyltransferase [Tateyamaria sp.]|uniref:class I SAM-dependent methyltransferase n=1 Tax=Tateyamaria sp. TaxID=1929288 RepID=UPI00329B2C88